jgi:hypothetical protein
MMFLLIVDILNNRIYLLLCMAKSTIPFLPLETLCGQTLFVYPF